MSYMNTSQNSFGACELTLAELDYVVGGCCCDGCSCDDGSGDKKESDNENNTKQRFEIKGEVNTNGDGGISATWSTEY